MLAEYLEEYVVAGQHSSEDTRREHLNTLLMNLFCLCRLADLFESDIRKKKQDAMPPSGKKKRGKSVKEEPRDEAVDWDWEAYKVSFLQRLFLTLDLTVELSPEKKFPHVILYLWNPPGIVDSSFAE